MQQQEVPRHSVNLRDNPEILSPPSVAPPYRCAINVKVTGFVPHADIDVKVDGRITTERDKFPWPDGALIEVPPLEAKQEVRARQRSSTGQSLWSAPVEVRDHLEDYPAGPPRPQINPEPVYRCGSRTGVAQREAITVDDHSDGNGIEENSLNSDTSQDEFESVDEYWFGRSDPALSRSTYNDTFYGKGIGMVFKNLEIDSRFRSSLRLPTDLGSAEIWIRAAEVFTGGVPSGATGFELGLEDQRGEFVWIDSDRVGGLPRPYARGSFTKTMLKTLRFPAGCFAAAKPSFDISNVVAILIRLNRPDQRALAFDDLQIIRV